jgi:hypothetical protein
VHPSYVLDSFSLNTNFSTDYDPDETDVVRELDLVRFDCPEGFVFSDTLNVSVYAMCYNWEWIYVNYDADSVCVREFGYLSQYGVAKKPFFLINHQHSCSGVKYREASRCLWTAEVSGKSQANLTWFYRIC